MMKMKPEQKIGAIFTAFGIAMGFLSVQLTTLTFAVMGPIAAYVAFLFLNGKMFPGKKRNWLIKNSILVFIMSWIVSWIFIFNI